jgi:DNA replication factor GINS
MESFMGVDGRTYALERGDIVTLPENNADVLCEHDIALNIRLNK